MDATEPLSFNSKVNVANTVKMVTNWQKVYDTIRATLLPKLGGSFIR